MAAELDAILLDARQLNADHVITGVLSLARGNFFQFLEGSHEALAAVMTRIRAAQCHTGIRILLDAPGAERRFQRLEHCVRRARRERAAGGLQCVTG